MNDYKCQDCGFTFITDNDRAIINCIVCGQNMEKK